jgi:hypothetical protein
VQVQVAVKSRAGTLVNEREIYRMQAQICSFLHTFIG